MRLLNLICMGVLLLSQIAPAEEKQKSGHGFTIEQVAEIKAAFIRPDGWFFTKEQNKGTLAIFITKEPFAENTLFETGVTINVFQSNPSAPNQIAKLFESIAAKHKVTVDKSVIQTKSGVSFLRLTAQFDATPVEGAKETRFLYSGLINMQTKTSYLVFFETPVSIWEENKLFGQSIINNLGLSGDI